MSIFLPFIHSYKTICHYFWWMGWNFASIWLKLSWACIIIFVITNAYVFLIRQTTLNNFHFVGVCKEEILVFVTLRYPKNELNLYTLFRNILTTVQKPRLVWWGILITQRCKLLTVVHQKWKCKQKICNNSVIRVSILSFTYSFHYVFTVSKDRQGRFWSFLSNQKRHWQSAWYIVAICQFYSSVNVFITTITIELIWTKSKITH